MTAPGCSPEHLNSPSLVLPSTPAPPQKCPKVPLEQPGRGSWGIWGVLRGPLSVPPYTTGLVTPTGGGPVPGVLGTGHTPGSCPCCWVPVGGLLNKRDAWPQRSPVILLLRHANLITTSTSPDSNLSLSSSTTLHSVTLRLPASASLPFRP